jgi:hypothetical protein
VSEFVLDASLAMTWCFESETTPYTKAILAQMGQGEQHGFLPYGDWKSSMLC